jgi:hypothetical protein
MQSWLYVGSGTDIMLGHDGLQWNDASWTPVAAGGATTKKHTRKSKKSGIIHEKAVGLADLKQGIQSTVRNTSFVGWARSHWL